MTDQTYEYYCARCDGVRMHRHRINDAGNYWACAGCGAANVLPLAASALAESSEAPTKDPWVGHSICASCKEGLPENGYYANNSVCPHCGASYKGTDLVVRRKLFTEPERKQSLWNWWFGELREERAFSWEIKETDG